MIFDKEREIRKQLMKTERGRYASRDVDPNELARDTMINIQREIERKKAERKANKG